jgi:putative oxidoreductase
MSIANSITPLVTNTRAWAGAGAHVLDLGIRLYVAKVFFMSGLTKIANWDSTVSLFEDEYRVPLLPPELAAALGTFGELVFPVLLALGLASRFAALSLFVVNLMAVLSYWHVLKDLEPALAQHWYWGVLLLVTMLHGPGKLALDSIVCKYWPALRPA